MKNITGAQLKSKIIEKLKYVGGTHDLVEALENCVIVNEDRLLDTGIIEAVELKGKTKFNFISKYKTSCIFDNYYTEDGELVSFTEEQVKKKLAHDLGIAFNGLYLVKPEKKW